MHAQPPRSVVSSLALSDHDLELVHRYFDGELCADEVLLVERLLEDEPSAREVLGQLRRIEQVARTEAISASYQEDFSDWWSAVERQMECPSLEPPPGDDPIPRPGPISIVDAQIREAERGRQIPWAVVLPLLLAAVTALALAIALAR